AGVPDSRHDIRMVEKNREQAGGKSEADLFADLDLDGAFKLVLYRVLESNDLATFVVGVGERGVKSGGLAAAGRAGEQDHALRQLCELREHGFLVRLHPQLT